VGFCGHRECPTVGAFMVVSARMRKRFKTRAELIALINAALRRSDVCDSVSCNSIYRVHNDVANWDSDALSAPNGRPVSPDCIRIFVAVKNHLQRSYNVNDPE
jgi:hypothetical protein